MDKKEHRKAVVKAMGTRAKNIIAERKDLVAKADKSNSKMVKALLAELKSSEIMAEYWEREFYREQQQSGHYERSFQSVENVERYTSAVRNAPLEKSNQDRQDEAGRYRETIQRWYAKWRTAGKGKTKVDFYDSAYVPVINCRGAEAILSGVKQGKLIPGYQKPYALKWIDKNIKRSPS
jgi:hypothetical protein